jgi:hypothetical protein
LGSSSSAHILRSKLQKIVPRKQQREELNHLRIFLKPAQRIIPSPIGILLLYPCKFYLPNDSLFIPFSGSKVAANTRLILSKLRDGKKARDIFFFLYSTGLYVGLRKSARAD